MQIARPALTSAIKTALGRNPVVVLTGPRQCGKTTLAREFLSEDSPNYFDLEDPASLSRLDEPMTALRPLRGLVVIDEVQRLRDLFLVLRVLADRRSRPAHFLILGSAAGDLLRESSESLAGRAEHIAIGGFSLMEVGADRSAPLWRRGGFPLAYLARTERDSLAWRKQFIQTLLERDLSQWGVRVPAIALQRFWTSIGCRVWNPKRAKSVAMPRRCVRSAHPIGWYRMSRMVWRSWRYELNELAFRLLFSAASAGGDAGQRLVYFLYFGWVYRKADPWRYASSPYEQDKYERTLAALRRVRGEAVPCRALEAGCGEGAFTEMVLREKLADSIIGIDISAISLARARIRCREFPRAAFIRANLATTAADGTFDLIICAETLYYLGARSVRACELLTNSLASGGRLVAVHPADRAESLHAPWREDVRLSLESRERIDHPLRPYVIDVFRRT